MTTTPMTTNTIKTVDLAPDLKRDARRYGVELPGRLPRIVNRPRIRWTGRRWVLMTAVGTPVAFADHYDDLRDFAIARFWV